MARGALCVPAASSSSERVFSASGGIVTDKRYNLATGTLKKLTLVKVNYEFVQQYMTIKILTTEEQMAMDWSQIQTPTTALPTTPSTSKTQTKLPFKRVDKLTKHKLICLSSSSSNTTSPEQSPSKKTPDRRTFPCLPPGLVEGKGKGKGKSSLTPTPPTPSQIRPTSEMDTQDLPPIQIQKRPKNSGLTPKDIQESLDMFDPDDDTNDPDFLI